MISKEIIGLDTYLYVYVTKEAANSDMEKLAAQGTITEVFIDNAFGFEFKKNRVIKFK
jgi:hypothetical protein